MLNDLNDNQHRSPADGMTDEEWHFRQHQAGTCGCRQVTAHEEVGGCDDCQLQAYNENTMLCDRCKQKLNENGMCLTCDEHALVVSPPSVEWWLSRLRYQHQIYLTQESRVNTLGVNLIKHAIYSTWCDLAAAAELAGDTAALETGKQILTNHNIIEKKTRPA